MTGFVSRPPSVDEAPPAAPPPAVIAGDGWFPDVDTAALREVVRLDTAITPARLREAVVNAMISLNAELGAWRAPLEVAGAGNMAAVPASQIGGRSILLALYDRAVASIVAADVAERLADVTATQAGIERSEEVRTVADEHRRNARWAVRDILGRRRTTVELI